MTTCIAPGCDQPGQMTFIAAASGRLGGRDWTIGDEIPVCWPHANDIYRTQGVTDPAQIAEWLRPDAADPPNTWHGDWYPVAVL